MKIAWRYGGFLLLLLIALAAWNAVLKRQELAAWQRYEAAADAMLLPSRSRLKARQPLLEGRQHRNACCGQPILFPDVTHWHGPEARADYPQAAGLHRADEIVWVSFTRYRPAACG
ncbi:MAG: hypothetical protein ACRYFX_28270 [Janthinobacterium lividum]